MPFACSRGIFTLLSLDPVTCLPPSQVVNASGTAQCRSLPSRWKNSCSLTKMPSSMREGAERGLRLTVQSHATGGKPCGIFTVSLRSAEGAVAPHV